MRTAEDYIRIFCDYFEANLRNIELAMEGPTTLGKLVDFQGDMPGGSGFFHDTLMPKIDKMKKIPLAYKRAQELFMLLPWTQQFCVFMWEYYIHRRVQDVSGEDVYLASGKDVARYLNINYNTFKCGRQRGIDRMNAELNVLIA